MLCCRLTFVVVGLQPGPQSILTKPLVINKHTYSKQTDKLKLDSSVHLDVSSTLGQYLAVPNANEALRTAQVAYHTGYFVSRAQTPLTLSHTVSNHIKEVGLRSQWLDQLLSLELSPELKVETSHSLADCPISGVTNGNRCFLMLSISPETLLDKALTLLSAIEHNLGITYTRPRPHHPHPP